jgi:hypothetical protein
MICLILNNAIILGPISWGDSSIRQALYIAGFSEAPGVLYAPDGSGLQPLPVLEPGNQIVLADGYAILPVTVVPDSPPAGQVVMSHTTTVAAGGVTVSPVYGPALVAPTLPLGQAQAQVVAAIQAQANTLVYGTYTDAAGNIWPVDQAHRVLMTGIESKLGTGMPLPATFSLTNASGVPIPMASNAFKALTTAIFNWTDAVFGAATAMSQAVLAETDPNVVLATNLTAGWPTQP